MRRRSFNLIRVFCTSGNRSRGLVVAGPFRMPCALGSAGPVHRKVEGDGGTPVAAMRGIAIHYRPDRARRPVSGLPVRRITPATGWCDDPRSAMYNRPVHLPFGSSHERMWRDDALYDVVVDLDWNRGPVRKSRGSAIFLHAARPGFRPTEGCIAVRRELIARLVARIGSRTRIRVVA